MAVVSILLIFGLIVLGSMLYNGLTQQAVCVNSILEQSLAWFYGVLSARLTRDGRVTISNRVQGLDRVQAGRLFDRFFTVEAANGSTGLGLSIAKLLTEKMGGRIWAAYKNETLQVFVDFPQ